MKKIVRNKNSKKYGDEAFVLKNSLVKNNHPLKTLTKHMDSLTDHC